MDGVDGFGRAWLLPLAPRRGARPAAASTTSAAPEAGAECLVSIGLVTELGKCPNSQSHLAMRHRRFRPQPPRRLTCWQQQQRPPHSASSPCGTAPGPPAARPPPGTRASPSPSCEQVQSSEKTHRSRDELDAHLIKHPPGTGAAAAGPARAHQPLRSMWTHPLSLVLDTKFCRNSAAVMAPPYGPADAGERRRRRSVTPAPQAHALEGSCSTAPSEMLFVSAILESRSFA